MQIIDTQGKVLTAIAPAGSNGNIQFNDDGTLTGEANLHWDKANGRLGIGLGLDDPEEMLHVAGNIKVDQVNALGGIFVSEGDVVINTSFQSVKWGSNDIQFSPRGNNILQLTSASGDGCLLEVRQRTASIPSPDDYAASFFSLESSGLVSMYAMDSYGTYSIISPHAIDAPAWLYDDDDPMPRVVKEMNSFIGIVRYTNESRLNKLQETVLTGGSIASLPAEKKKLLHVETFAEHNARRGLPPEKQLKILDWSEEQKKKQAAYDAAREAAIAKGQTPLPARDVQLPMPAWISKRLEK